MIEMFIKPMLGLATGLISHFVKRQHLKLECSWSHVPNGNGVGTFLALAIKIINPGTESIFFERLEATNDDGEIFFPLFFLVNAGAEIVPRRSLVGLIPCGHVRHKGIREIRVVDETENVYVLKGKKLRTVVEGLLCEMSRLEALGFAIHPVSPYPG